jgi:Cdc6-like AAA superfamily ATPase
LEIRKIIENGNEEQKTSMLPSTPYLQRHRQVYSSHEPGTGQWFLSHKRFRTWKDGNSPSTLLCTGPPGAGKSVLASLAVENVSKNMTNDDVQVAYLFCQYQHQISETAAILLSSILRQLLTPERVIFPFVRDKWLEIFNSPSTTAKLSNQLVPLIRILSAKSKRTYIIIDAIDEILETGPRGEDVRDDFLRSMIGLSSDCRILFTSRTHIDWDYYPAPSTRSILEIRAKDEDIIAYCTSAINASKSLSQYCKRLPTLRDNIIRTVVLKASGM